MFLLTSVIVCTRSLVSKHMAEEWWLVH